MKKNETYIQTQISTDLIQAVKLLKEGGVVALPTETVYGLAADIYQADAVKMIFTLKQRPADNPLIVHIASLTQLDEIGINIPENARIIARAFWPGPLTMVLKKSQKVNDLISAGQDTVAVRMPSHPVMLSILQQLGSPLAAPSANIYTKVSPTTAQHVYYQFKGKIPLIIDGGRCQTGIESTIIDLTNPEGFRVLREGVITAEQISEKTHVSMIDKVSDGCANRAPGQHFVHYSPDKPLYRFENAGALNALFHYFSGKKIGVLRLRLPIESNARVVSLPRDPIDYAYEIYYQLYEADTWDVDVLFIEMPPCEPGWGALRDKIKRASQCYLS